MTRITAHAGCDGTRPGTLAGLYHAHRLGADTLELDLRLQGHTVVLSHDPLHNDQKYVTLDAVLREFAQTSVHFNCDLKEERAFAPALACFQAHQMEARAEFTGRYPPEPADDRVCYRVYWNAENIPGIPEGIPLSKAQAVFAANWFEKAQRVQTCLAGLNIEWAQLSPAALDVFTRRGIALSCWTVNKPEDLISCFAAGVANVTTDCVGTACAARAALFFRPGDVPHLSPEYI